MSTTQHQHRRSTRLTIRGTSLAAKISSPHDRRKKFPVTQRSKPKPAAARTIPVRDGDAEARKQRRERIQGIIVLIAVVLFFGFLLWLASIAPHGNTSDIYYMMP